MPRFRTPDMRQRLMVPVSLEDQLVPGTLEFAIHDVVEHRLDLSCFHARFHNDDCGRPAVDPKVLLKVVLLGYSRGLIGSRRIELACRENVLFMAMTGGDVIDHSTIADFISGMPQEVESVFLQVLMVCEEMGLLGGTVFAMDGCKLPGNASRRWSGTLRELEAKQTSLEKKVARLVSEHQKADRSAKKDDDDHEPPEDHRQRQIERLGKQAERIQRFLAGAKPRIGRQGTEIKGNITDPESAKMSTSHGTIQGYNAQAVVDAKHQIVVAGFAAGEGGDVGQAVTVLPILKRNLESIGRGPDALRHASFLADSGYFSRENLTALELAGVDSVIPDRHFRQRDERLTAQAKHQPIGHKKFPLDRFRFEPAADRYRCPADQTLRSNARQTLFNGRRCRMYVGRPEICQACRLRVRCLTGNARRRTLVIPLADTELPITDRMKAKIDSPAGRERYGKRLGIVEPVFANLVENKRLRRFSLRGTIKATIQWLLWCIVHNLEKVGAYGYAT